MEPRTIHGQVVNALTGAGVPRALVALNGIGGQCTGSCGVRQVLTDSEGRFAFRQFAALQASIMATKPGFGQSADPSEMYIQHAVADLSAALEVKLYPYGIIAGSVAGPDGLPLSQISVTIVRANYEVSGLRWRNVGVTMTNSRGEYRFAVPAGRLRLMTGYNPHARETGAAVLPTQYPADSSSNTLSSWISLSFGEEKRIDLRPRTGTPSPVLVRVDGTNQRENLRFSAVASGGETMNLNSASGPAPGEYRVELPTGSYLLHAQSDTRDESLYGSGQVTVTGESVPVLTLHLAPTTSIPVEVAIDPGSLSVRGASDPSPAVNAAQLGLFLHELSGGDISNPDILLRGREDRTFEFRVSAGRYRLSANNGGGWYVVSATYGGVANLLTSDLAIAPGSAGEPIRLTVGNQRGDVQGQVPLPSGASSAWVYFFPRQPALVVPNPQPTGADGSFFASLPRGAYSVVAFSRRVLEDLRNPETVERLTAGATVVEVTSGTNPVIKLNSVQTLEVPR